MDHAGLGFSHRATAGGAVLISRAGREVVTLRGKAAARFLAKAEGCGPVTPLPTLEDPRR